MRMEHRVRSRPSGRLGTVGERVVEGMVDIPSLASRGMSMDINTASVLRLKSLSGIGGHYAMKIVEGRPYRNCEELLTRQILPQYIYGRIMDRLVVGQP